MIRLFVNELKAWKTSKKRKPLILQGARQVGKTWVMKEFGKQEFKNTVYLNFESSERLKNMFIPDFDIERMIKVMEIESGQSIQAKDTLIILDEIQEAEKGITSLKYFYEKAPQYFIIAAGSLLGISLQKKNSFPVGKVDLLKLHPMNYTEFLINTGDGKLVKELENENWEVIDSFHDYLIVKLRLYYFIGGMPEAVNDYIQTKDLNSVRSIQQKIIAGYENDFAKHAPSEIVPRIRMIWNSIISQLAKENKKFIYGQLKSGARAKDFELAINWLNDAGLILKVNRIDNGKLPLKAYADLDAFKLFLVDLGLLNAMAGLEPRILLEKNNILTEYKGALTEQYVCQQLHPLNDLYYWSLENSRAEVDFVIQKDNKIIPIEVKAEENLKAKSLKVFTEKYKSKRNIRTSMSKYREESWLVNVPLYALTDVLK